MFYYRAFDLTLSSEFPLSDLVETQTSPDVVVGLRKLSDLDYHSLDSRHAIFGKLSDIGTFLITGGREIMVEPDPGIDESILSPCILGPAMSVILRQRGYLVLHASCVALKQEGMETERPAAIAFLGASGSGKSTLAQAFQNRGYKVLTDDVMAIRFEQGIPYVIPSFPQGKLTSQAATALGIKPDQLAVLSTNAGKLSYGFRHGFQETPLPLQRIYVLAKGPCHDITPLPQQAAFTELIRHTRAVDIMTAPTHSTAHLQQCTSLLMAVSMSQFARRPALNELPLLIDLVQADLTQAYPQKLESRILQRT